MSDNDAIRQYEDTVYSADWKNWTDPEIPERFDPTTLLLDKHLNTPTSKRIALIVDDETLTYEALHADMCRAASLLVAAGVNPEGRVLLFGTDSREYIATWLGAVRAGMVPAGVSDLHKDSDLSYFLSDTDAYCLFIDSEQLEKLEKVGSSLPVSLAVIIVRGECDTDDLSTKLNRKVLSYDDLIKDQPDTFSPCPRHSNDVCYMLYSGGTTGSSKGVTHLAHDFYLVPERHGHFWEYTPDDVILTTSKKYFTHGLWPGVLIPLYWGACTLLTRKPPTPDLVIEMIEKHRVTKFITVPTVIKNMLGYVRDKEDRPDFSSVTLTISASEKIPPEVFKEFQDHFGVEIFDSIGSSEVTYEWIANRQKENKSGTLGKPVFGFEIKLMDPDGNQVTEPGTPGEAWVKSRTACFYYWRKYDSSRETFIGPWTRTGDRLSFDEDGFFSFVGRDSDVFKVKGLWVSPIEIEAVLTEHNAVLEAAVIPMEDADGFTKPKASVVLHKGAVESDALAEELRQSVRRIGGYKMPEEIEFIDELPRTPLMKINRKALRELEEKRA